MFNCCKNYSYKRLKIQQIYSMIPFATFINRYSGGRTGNNGKQEQGNGNLTFVLIQIQTQLKHFKGELFLSHSVDFQCIFDHNSNFQTWFKIFLLLFFFTIKLHKQNFLTGINVSQCQCNAHTICVNTQIH